MRANTNALKRGPLGNPGRRPYLFVLLLAGSLLFGLVLAGALSADVALPTGAPALPEAGADAGAKALALPPQDLPATPWYRTPEALVLYGVGVVVFLLVVVWGRTSYLERQSKELQRLVAERTEEVERRKGQIESYNRELLRTNEALRRTVEEKSTLLGTAAHDLKNPLFGIRALSEIVLETESLSPKSERKLNLIRESADETLHLIDELLATAASSAQSSVDPEPVDVTALTQWVVRSFDPHAERKKQTLHYSVDAASPCVVEGDKRKLREAITNLVSNALKYSPPESEVEVVVASENGEVRVSVIDEGPGLSETDRQRMFAPFQRLTPEPTGGEGSSGLGLYIVKQIAELHEGRVEVESEVGQGSTFRLVLPVASPDDVPTPTVEPGGVEGADATAWNRSREGESGGADAGRSGTGRCLVTF